MSDEGALTPLADGVWVTSAPVRILGMRLTTTMTVLRLSDGDLVLYSPVAATTELRSAVEKLGPVAHLYAPNTYHHLWVGEWAAAFPSARLHAPPALVTKRPDLHIDRVVGEQTEPAFEGAVDEVRIEGFRLQEVALLHRAGRTLVVADLVHNVGRPTHLWTKLYVWMMGYYDRVAMSRMIRWFGFNDRRAARRSVDELLNAPFDQIALGHGAPVVSNARDTLEAAYRWL